MMNRKEFIKYFSVSLCLVLLALILSFEGEIKYPTENFFIASSHHQILQKPDFSEIKDFSERKASFINYMLSAINIANKEICLEKKQISSLKKAFIKKQTLNKKNLHILNEYLKYYKIKTDTNIPTQLKLLELKANTVPTSFILAQAILESGWGTSRFAENYNNYFGLHCYYKNCGVKALEADVYLEVFDNASDSILGYYHRLNTGSNFKDFRVIRAKVERNELPTTALFDTLENYSEIGSQEYKQRLINIITVNNLTQYDSINYC
ncbi:glucosaminidase domain-containing protein [Francisella sp. LA112445]|uniref:glucosaminidase domain-containing protein n=1 Tax=Francisella sp. LA112445 TaxID=1395624 RepID=UPI001788CDD6|nr:glucosaminidase domain-containing protein [Francisella sp. LA112445]QIW11091.1 BAX protein [Francisella sp. LA112445]